MMALTCDDAPLTHPLNRVVFLCSLSRTQRPGDAGSRIADAPAEDTGWARAFSRQRTIRPVRRTCGPVSRPRQSRYPVTVPFHPPRRRSTLILAALGGFGLDAGFPGLGWWP